MENRYLGPAINYYNHRANFNQDHNQLIKWTEKNL
jgi:hypothetical protein